MSAEAVWGAWADVERWGEWNADVARIGIDGPFAARRRSPGRREPT